MSDQLNIWKSMHANRALQASFPPLIREHWNRCSDKKIPPCISAFPAFDEKDFDRIKQNSIKLYAYANRFITRLMGYLSNPTIAFALFDSNGCLLKLYGLPDTLAILREQGIVRMTDWSEESIGANAISIGLEHNKIIEVSGAQNYCRLLLDKAVYFAPISLENESNGNIPVVFGGTAIIVPYEKAHPDYLLTAFSTSNDIVLHIFMADNLHQMYMTETSGMMSIDISVLTGKNYILYHNINIFNVLDIPYTNLYFKRVDTLFDPLPKNRNLWDILEKRKRVTDRRIRICCRGKEDDYIVTTDPYHQRELGILGIRFYITSPRVISSQVSRKIGNNAIITFQDILGDSLSILNTIQYAKTIAASDSNVLLLGESGVGKDIFAQAIHNASKRCGKPFIAVNCAAFPRDLIASELFGYEGGAFTGSKKEGNIGKFELADTGTIFLDEIGDMPLDLQATLLRVIEQKSFMRLGGSTEIKVNVKIIAATNADLQQLIDQKKFRADLYYRLSILRLTIPPLRERGDDIILLAEHFILSVSRRIQKPNIMTLSDEAKELLHSLPWYGNVRELQNLIEGIVQLNPIDVIEPGFIREYLGLPENSGPERQTEREYGKKPASGPPPETHTAAIEITREDIENGLRINHFNKTNTAKYLGISRKTLYRRLDALDIQA